MKILSFADDTTVYLAGPSVHELEDKANSELIKLNDWFCANQLSLNVKKTKFSLFKPQQHNTDNGNIEIKINGINISQAGNTCDEKAIRFLGLDIDETLTWKNHITKICQKITTGSAIFIINRVKRFLPHTALKTLYFAMIHNHIMYGIQAWGHSIHSNQVYTLQKRAIRIINNKGYRHHTETLFKKDKILKYPELYKLQVSIFIHDWITNSLPNSFTSLFAFNSSVTNVRTRQSSLIYSERARTNFTAKLPKHGFPKIWNELPRTIHESKTKNILKNKLKSHYLTQYSSTINCVIPNCYSCLNNR